MNCSSYELTLSVPITDRDLAKEIRKFMRMKKSLSARVEFVGAGLTRVFKCHPGHLGRKYLEPFELTKSCKISREALKIVYPALMTCTAIKIVS